MAMQESLALEVVDQVPETLRISVGFPVQRATDSGQPLASVQQVRRLITVVSDFHRKVGNSALAREVKGAPPEQETSDRVPARDRVEEIEHLLARPYEVT